MDKLTFKTLEHSLAGDLQVISNDDPNCPLGQIFFSEEEPSCWCFEADSMGCTLTESQLEQILAKIKELNKK